MSWWVDNPAAWRDVRVRDCSCGGVVITTAYSLSTRWIRAMVPLLSRRVALDVASVYVRVSVGRGCVSWLALRALLRLVVSRRGFGCVGRACSCRVRRRVSVIVLLLSRRLLFVTAAVNVCLSVGR